MKKVLTKRKKPSYDDQDEYYADLSKILAKNIRKYRLKAELSQDRLSKLSGVALNTITKIEAGDTPNPTIETVKRLADGLEMAIDKLLLK